MRFDTPAGTPEWNDGQQQRMLVSLLLATVFVAAGLSVIRFPAFPGFAPLVDIAVRIVQQRPPADRTPQRTAEGARVADEPARTASPQAADAHTSRSMSPGPGELVERDDVPVDWEMARQRAIDKFLDSQQEDYGYFDPNLSETRRSQGPRYGPQVHEAPKPIWENVEKDTLGRTILRSGDCFKVLDDPNVSRRVQFELFGQYLTQCTYQKRRPKRLPWVDEIRERYAYLRDPDGYVAGEGERN